MDREELERRRKNLQEHARKKLAAMGAICPEKGQVWEHHSGRRYIITDLPILNEDGHFNLYIVHKGLHNDISFVRSQSNFLGKHEGAPRFTYIGTAMDLLVEENQKLGFYNLKDNPT